jgi:hypothetical protein
MILSSSPRRRSWGDFLADGLPRWPSLYRRALRIVFLSNPGGEPIGSVTGLLDARLAHFTAVCNEDRARHPGDIWGNKVTTEHIGWLELNGSRVDVVARFAASVAEYRKIFIIRDGRSCVDSKVRRAGLPMIQAAVRWCYCVCVLDRLSDLGELCTVVR